MNPDPDFVLRGAPSSYWSRPGYLNNSQLTTTTKGLEKYTPDIYEDYESKRMTQSLRNMSHNLNKVSSNLKQSLIGGESMSSLGRHSSLRTTATEEELVNLDDLDSRYSHASLHDKSQWYTKPVHLSQTYTPQSSTYVRPRSVSPVSHPTGTLGAALDDEVTSQSRVFHEMEYKRLRNEDSMAAAYFPVTLGAAYYMQAADAHTGRPIASLNGPSRSRAGILKKTKRAKSAARVDEVLQDVPHRHYQSKMTFLASEAPTIASSVNVIACTPYQNELARLRMERLRIEEDRLLEMKRQEELERIRGPKPKWYEMKSPEFHYEAHKNNQLIKSRDKWDDILEYREDLTSASRNFERSWETPLLA